MKQTLLAGDYLPDLPDLGNPGATVARNVIPHKGGYKPFPSANVYSNALDTRCMGAVSVQDKDGNTLSFASDAQKLYKEESGTYTDVSGTTYSTATVGGYWEFASWGTKLFATNFADNPQQITLSGGTVFSDLTGDLKARHVAVIRDFAVLGNTFDATDGNKPNRVRWSAIGDETSWTVSGATQSDYQDIQNSGWVQRVFGGEYGVVLTETSIWRMSYVGSPDIFQFDETLPDIGTIFPRAAVQYGDIIFMLSNDGFKAVLNGVQLKHIGANKVDQTFFKDVDTTNPDLIVAGIDYKNQVVMWIYPSSGQSNPNKFLLYNWTSDRWAHGEEDLEFIFNHLSAGYTLDGLDSVSGSIDALLASLDSRVWTGGDISFAGFNHEHKQVNFTGTAKDCSAETGEVNLVQGGRAFISSLRPLVDGGTPTCQSGTRNRQQDSYSFGLVSTSNTIGECPVRSDGRYHRIRINNSGDFNDLIGVEVTYEASGDR